MTPKYYSGFHSPRQQNNLRQNRLSSFGEGTRKHGLTLTEQILEILSELEEKSRLLYILTKVASGESAVVFLCYMRPALCKLAEKNDRQKSV